MKITKEKIVYFLSLNFISFGFCFALFVIGLLWLFGADEGTIFYYIKTMGFKVSLLFFSLILLASIIVFLYFYIKKESYNIFMSAFFSLIPLFVFLFYIFITEFLGDYFEASVIFGIFTILFFGYVFSLIVLKITEPLRKKIVW